MIRPPRPFALVKTEDQWRRAAHQDTALIGEVVQLAWTEADRVDHAGDPPQVGAGLAFDGHCRLFRSIPEEGRVERWLWAARERGTPVDVFARAPEVDLGDFRAAPQRPGTLADPLGLAVDANERLWVAEAGAGRVLVVDLWSRQWVGEISLAGRPVDLVALGSSVWVLLEAPARVVRLDAAHEPREVPGNVAFEGHARLAVSASREIWVLERAGTDAARLLCQGRPPLEIPRATDLEFQSDEVLVVARHPGEDFLTFRVAGTTVDALAPLAARGYDGRGIVRTPDGRIGFWTERGFRHALVGRVKYRSAGQVTTFRLDSGEYRTAWGRLFMEACIPADTRIRVHCVTADEPPTKPYLVRTSPANSVTMEIRRPDLSPPLPPLALMPPTEADFQPGLHRRVSGRELPWTAVPKDDPFVTYEAPILAPPGRYLWVTVRLEGNTRATPRFRALRAEFPSHDLLRRLPKVFSREPADADFLRRFLAMFEGHLSDWEGRGVARHALLDSRSTPEEFLPWLAGFVGLVLDPRWPVEVRRRLIEEAIWLFRFRGTVPGLRRFLEICVGAPVIILEKFRTRGLGGALLGGSATTVTNSVLGAGFRIGGAVGATTETLLSGSVEDMFATHAHRFTVLIPRMLSEEEIAAVEHLLAVHRPAHTAYQLCTVGAGMRVGRGLHVELTSVIGRTSGFRPTQLDRSLLGRDTVLGPPAQGFVPGGSRVGRDARIG